MDSEKCWIDGYISRDRCRHWSHAGQISETGPWNGNPPALVRMGSGKLCCVFGERKNRQMIAVYSDDRGTTWDNRTVLRDDFEPDRFNDPDLGYPQVIQKKGGKLAAFYYWAATEHPEQHIACTMW